MDKHTAQAADVDYVKQRCIAMQRARFYGYLQINFEAGEMQLVRTQSTELPPSRKKNEKKP